MKNQSAFLRLIPLFLAVALTPGTFAAAATSHFSIYKDDLPTKPKVPPAFTPLPVGQVRPSGWLLDWAKDAGSGLAGHLDDYSPTFSNAWKGFHFKAQGVETNGTGWPLEQCSYWLDGLVRLAFILDDQSLIDKARSRLDLVVDGVLKGGESLIYWQPKSTLDGTFNFDNWAHSHMGRALVAYYQATGDPRVLEALQRVYRDYPLPDITTNTSVVFTGVSGIVNIDAMLDTYAMSGDEQVLNNALAFAARQPFRAILDEWSQDQIPLGHTVIFYENARVPALLYPWTGDAQMLRATRRVLEQGDRHHGLPMGVCSGEEFLAGIGSTRHIETCDIAAAQWTYNWLLRITGDRHYADRIERMFFNAGPAPVDQDFQTMSYFQVPNRVGNLLPGERAYGGGLKYNRLGGGAYCCPGNLCRILPNYIMHMWMATPDHGLAATLYGPCQVKTTVAGQVPVTIDCQTDYPFEETVRMTVQPKTSATFPLYLRIPAWSAAASVKINEKPIRVEPGTNGFLKIVRRWNPGDRVILQLPMTVRVERGRETPFPQMDYFKKESIYKRNSAQLTNVSNPYATVNYGPLLFALPIPDNNPNQMVGKTPFNFALEADEGQLAEKIKVQRETMPQPWKWRWDKAPVQLGMPARQFDWTPTPVQPLPQEAIAGGVATNIALIPYGCTKFHVTMFPVAKSIADSAPPPSKDRLDLVRALENRQLSLAFDENTGVMIRLENKLTGEVYSIKGDEFAVNTGERVLGFSDFKLLSLIPQPGRVTARYQHPKLTIEVVYSLGEEHAFVEKKLQMTFKEACGLKKVVVSKPTFSADGLQTVCYRYPVFEIVRAMVKSSHGWDFTRPPNSEPTRTFFGRTAKGGFFTGIEMPYDESAANENSVMLGYAPNLKIAAGQKLDGETIYLGVYGRSEQDGPENNSWQAVQSLWLTPKKEGFDGAAAAGVGGKGAAAKKEIQVSRPDVMPLPSEYQALSAMVTAEFGPPRHGLKAYACGYHSQMQLDGYDSEQELEADMKALELFKECGLDGFSESSPWGGETRKMNALREGDRFEMGDRNRRLYERAKALGLEVTQWPTINNTHPWNKLGGPLRLDKPEWLRVVKGKPSLRGDIGNFQQQFANCVACQPFYNWLEQFIGDTLATGFYKSWCMDGDFWGTGAYFHTTIPVTCQADYHDHLAGDSNYACQKRLEQMFAKVRQQYPTMYIIACRPAMDLGVWAMRDVDSCFTLIETGTGGSNIAGGNEIRTASRIRLQHQFIPPWLDAALLFPSCANPERKTFPRWPGQNLDYILLSALSSTPNLLLYLPGHDGIPEASRQEIKQWLEWGRRNEKYLLARHDLPAWPQKGKVDGSAHLLGDHGLIFLFNSDGLEHTAEFALTRDGTGFTGSMPVEISQEYPARERREISRSGATVRWPVPPESVAVLCLKPQ